MTASRFIANTFSLLVLLASAGTAALQDSLSTAATDTTAADSVRNLLIPSLGQLRPGQDSSSYHYARFLWSDVRTVADLYRYQPGVFARDLGTAGSPDQLIINGIDARGLAFLMDGRPLRDPVTGTMNINDVPIEFIDHLENLPAMEAIPAAENSSSGAINIVTRQYNTGRPLTKIRFMQGPNEHLLTDAQFTQNVTRELNILAGVQRQVSDDRFLNTAYDSWNVRTRIRWNVSDRLNLSLSDLYRTSTGGMNNGINIDSTKRLGLDEFNNAEAVPYSPTASEHRTRRDATFTAAGLLLPDTSSRTVALVYYTDATREYRPGDQPASSFDRYAFEIHGGLLRQFLTAGPLHARLEVNVERRLVGLGTLGTRDFRSRAWSADISLSGLPFRPSAFFRGEAVGKAEGFSWGAGGVMTAWGGSLTFSGGYAETKRFPSLQELNWHLYQFQGDLNLLEQHTMFRFGSAVKLRFGELQAEYSHRTIANALVFRIPFSTAPFSFSSVTIIPELEVQQVAGSITLRSHPFTAKGGLTWTEVAEASRITSAQPNIILTGEFFYEDELLDGALGIRLGLVSRFIGRHTAGRYLPAGELFAEAGGKTLKPFSTVDLYGIFHVGDAFVIVSWENPLDRQFMTAYPYPAMGRSVRVGINWIFLD